MSDSRVPISEDAAINAVISASLRSVAPGQLPTVEALASLIQALGECLEAALWLRASGLTDESLGAGPINEWDSLGVSIANVGGAAVRLMRAICEASPTGETIDDMLERVIAVGSRESISEHRDDWRTAPSHGMAVAMWSCQLRRRLTEAVAQLAQTDLARAQELLILVSRDCVDALVELAPRHIVCDTPEAFVERYDVRVADRMAGYS